MIFHAEKRRGFLMIDRRPLDDPKLSLKAKGLLAYFLSKPPDWRPRIPDILSHCLDGEKSVRAALKNLRDLGYIKLIRNNLSSGRIEGTEWAVYEIPQSAIDSLNRPPSCRFTETRKTGMLSNTKEGTNNEASRKPSFAEIEKLKNFIKDEETRASVIKEIRELLSSTLELPEDSPYRDQWMDRANQCPMRVEWAIGMVDEDHAEIRALEKLGCKNVRRLTNPSGKANWYFLNVNPQTGELPK